MNMQGKGIRNVSRIKDATVSVDKGGVMRIFLIWPPTPAQNLSQSLKLVTLEAEKPLDQHTIAKSIAVPPTQLRASKLLCRESQQGIRGRLENSKIPPSLPQSGSKDDGTQGSRLEIIYKID
ncbi:predicted protein [Histoplasma capsulatum G186AR]|uniref:Uncharacterized protein n=1 Tax=Ajellomyces capsulatus (strain G186AR / H82 / ATCC MYA-2454 / RMSCC 2432) TaxID=447093 RepID=C0NE49_AJECG|nr:uncharacterized protein HCBG_02142 [Histoplasma capsulatum G186AR]EEH10497.1 predicted protein [Histoplasma capsulatum G186AR]